MARFGRDLVRSLTQPAFADQVSNVGMLIGSMPSRQREEEARQERMQRETEAFTIYEQGLRSSEDANVAGVTAASKRLSGMLTDETSETVRSDLMKKISELGALQETTQTAKDQRNITDLIQAENLLNDLKEKGDARTENENAVMEAVQQRVDQLRQISSVVVGAKNTRRNARISELTKDEALKVAETNAMKRDLAQFVGTAQFTERAQRYRDMGLSQQVDVLEKEVLTVMTERQDLIDKLNERAPLTAEEKKIITDLGFKTSGDTANGIKTDRQRLNQIKETKFQKELDIALRPLDPASAGLAKAYVIETLEEIVQEGDIEDLPFYQDISDKVADILEDPEELEFFLNKVEGASPAEISSIVTDYLKKKFPKKFEDMQTEIRRKATIETTRQGALANIAASTNAARGRAAFEAGMIDEDRPLTPDDEGYFDLSNPDDADRALMLYEREENKKRKARQKKEQLSATTGVGLTSRSGFNL
jgi:hypothetical protein